MFDCNLRVNAGGVFLYIPKACGKVWYPGLPKLETYGVKGKFLNLLSNYFHERSQRVVLDEQFSTWKFIPSGES